MIHARKRFGQHFLTDFNVLDQIVSAINPSVSDYFFEIGPGPGVLTRCLLQQVKHLDVVEIDRDLVAKLKHDFAGNKQLSIHEGDALQFNIRNCVRKNSQLRVVGNLPYNISTPLLFKLFADADIIKDMHFLLQKEVVERITAAAGSSHFGRLSVMSQYYCDSELLFTVGPDAFTPPPKVYSAFIHLVPRKNPTIVANNFENFSDIVREAFSHRRKTLSNALKKFISPAQLMQLDIDPAQRPQQISYADYVRISNSIEVK